MVNENTNYSPEVVMSILSAIPDPEIPVISIRELGMLQRVSFRDGKYVVYITPTYTACPAMKMVEDEILSCCAKYGIKNVQVELVYTPAWTTDWISPDAKEKLKKYGIAPPQKKACTTSFGKEYILCPVCSSANTELISRFGSTACKSMYKCKNCLEPFEYFKCH